MKTTVPSFKKLGTTELKLLKNLTLFLVLFLVRYFSTLRFVLLIMISTFRKIHFASKIYFSCRNRTRKVASPAPEPSSQFFGIGVAGSEDLQSSDRSEPEGLALCERKPGTLNVLILSKSNTLSLRKSKKPSYLLSFWGTPT